MLQENQSSMIRVSFIFSIMSLFPDMKYALTKDVDSLSKFCSRERDQKMNVYTDKKTKHLFRCFIDGQWFCIFCLLEIPMRIKCLFMKEVDSLSKFCSREMEQKVNVYTNKKTKHLFWCFIDGKWFCLSCLLEVPIRTVNKRPDLYRIGICFVMPRENPTLLTCISIQTSSQTGRLPEEDSPL